MTRTLSLLFSLYWITAHCKLFTDPSQLPKTSYDFIIIGGGTAGNVIASRLTENPGCSVLVVEAGISDQNILTECPFLGAELIPASPWTWNFTTVPQVGLSGRSIQYPRGRTLGGSSSVNFEIWTRGSADDYNRYAAVTGDEGWSWKRMLPYLLKSEHLVPPTDHHDTTGDIDPLLHGTSGPIEISIPGTPNTVDERFTNGTTSQFPDEFPFNPDMNSGLPLGIGWAQVSVGANGHRSSSSVGYLTPNLGRANLDVLIQTQVTRLIKTGSHNGLPAFMNVEIAQTASSRRKVLTAHNEVILSAGAIGTPQILQLSGIGDPKLLKKVKIDTLVNLPDVGQHLTDHPFLGNHWVVDNPNTLEGVGRNATLVGAFEAQWVANGTGLFSDPGSNTIAWTRVPNSAEFQKFTDPSAGANSPHHELLAANGFVSFVEPTPETGNFMSLVTAVVTPASRGSVTLASSNPFDFPLIDPALLKDDFDIFVMTEAIKAARRVVTASAWNGYILREAEPLASAKTDEQLINYARNLTTTVFHPAGTARMSADNSSTGVVTSKLLVKGISGLRIVDASVMPFLPAGHPQAVVYAIAERAADLIKDAWSLY